MCICVRWDLFTCSDRRIVMEGSSESGWPMSGSSRGLNSPPLLDRNSRSIRARSSGDNTSHDYGFIPATKGREKAMLSSLLSHYRAHVGDGPVPAPAPAPSGPTILAAECKDVSLRRWLDNPQRKVDALECLHIFSQIVEIINRAHSQGIVFNNVRPSCLVISSFNRISFTESASYSDSAEFKNSVSPLSHGSHSPKNAGLGELGTRASVNAASHVSSEGSCFQLCPGTAMNVREAILDERTEDKRHSITWKQILLMESHWYRSPEEAPGGPSSCASDIYQLGVLLFELFYTFGSMEEKNTTMASLRQRVLPPQMLLTWPKQTSFCLWLLHPEPSCRPKLSELLHSEFLNEPRDDIEEQEAAIELREKIEEQELLLEFLLLLQQRKQDAADSLNGTIAFISSDIEEVTNMNTVLRRKGGSYLDLNKNPSPGLLFPNAEEDNDSGSTGSRKRVRQGLCINSSDEPNNNVEDHHNSEMRQASFLSKNSQVKKNFRKFESAYLMARRRAVKPTCRVLTQPSSSGRGSIVATERSSISNLSSKELCNDLGQSGWVTTFLEGLSKYLSYSKLKVKANLKQGDLLNSSNLVCSLDFDRDGEFFATAGVNKKIKVFDYKSILSEDRDIHYPAVEMSSKSKFSSICWNGYIKSQIASSNFDGVVQVWDVSRSQTLMEMKEHERRVWSVDFSSADPTMLASGSDDGSVKLWNINQGVTLGTIKTKANVCCVQFPTDSGRFLAFGSADHRIYYYDLRNSKMPLCTLVGHNKTVSYVKFIDSTTLVSASTDNTIKLWDLSMCKSRVWDCPLQTFTGHLNIKNFVGLSVSDGYIATGSETNEVFVYHKAFPMPALSFKFNSTDPFLGDKVDDNAQFISSVCWHGQSSTLVAANSMGNIKLLEMG